ADIGEVFGDIADVLVLGPAREDFVADDQDRGGDNASLDARLAASLAASLDASLDASLGVGHWDQNSVLPPPLARQRWRLKARHRNGHNAHFMSNNGRAAWPKPSRRRNDLARRLLERTVGWAKGA